MNNKLIWGTTAVVAITAGIIFISQKDTPSNAAPNTSPQEENVATSAPAGKLAGAPAVDLSRCSKQQNDAYLCAPDALANFGPAAITDTASGNTCTIAYDRSVGFSFKGPTKTAVVPAGPLAVAVYPSGLLATAARSAAQTVSFHAREDGALDHTLFVDSNFATEQCLAIQ